MEETVVYVQMELLVRELHHADVLNADLELKPMPHWVDVNIVLRETFQLRSANVNLVLLGVSPLDLERLNVNYVRAGLKHLWIELLVYLAVQVYIH
jgi:hypothetical protein